MESQGWALRRVIVIGDWPWLVSLSLLGTVKNIYDGADNGVDNQMSCCYHYNIKYGVFFNFF